MTSATNELISSMSSMIKVLQSQTEQVEESTEVKENTEKEIIKENTENEIIKENVEVKNEEEFYKG